MTNPYGSSAPQPPDAPGYGQQPMTPQGSTAPTSGSYGTGATPGGPAVPPAQPPKKRWPWIVGIGCGCLALLLAVLLFLIFGLHALGSKAGDDDTTSASPTTTTSSTPSDTDSATPTDTDSPTTDSPTPTAAGPVAPEDQQAAKDRFWQWAQAVDGGDYQGACRLMTLPDQTEPMPEAGVSACADSLKGQNIDQGQLTGITEDILDTRGNDDGTVTISSQGEDFPYSMVKASDGQWYIHIVS